MRTHWVDSRKCYLHDSWDYGSRNSRDPAHLHIHGFLLDSLERYSHRVCFVILSPETAGDQNIADRSHRYTVEVMSYDIRSKLICTQNLLVQATITGFNYLNPVALENISWKYVSFPLTPLGAICIDMIQVLHHHMRNRGARDPHGLLHLPGDQVHHSRRDFDCV
jgi:hypothetical protein